MERLAKQVEFGFWEAYDDAHTIIRFATSWATRPEDAEALSYILTKQVISLWKSPIDPQKGAWTSSTYFLPSRR